MSSHSDSASRSTPQTLVVVHAVDESGATGEPLGTATVIDTDFALASRPLNEQLAQRPRRLRVGIFTVANLALDSELLAGTHEIALVDTRGATRLSAVGEVVDVDQIRVLAEDSELVLLELATDTSAPPVLPRPPRPDPSREDVVAALRAVLDRTPLPDWTVDVADGGLHFIGNPIHWFRIVFGWG